MYNVHTHEKINAFNFLLLRIISRIIFNLLKCSKITVYFILFGHLRIINILIFFRSIWSVLYPIFYILYKNDLPEGLLKHCKMYADDINDMAENLQMVNNSLQTDNTG